MLRLFVVLLRTHRRETIAAVAIMCLGWGFVVGWIASEWSAGRERVDRERQKPHAFRVGYQGRATGRVPVRPTSKGASYNPPAEGTP